MRFEGILLTAAATLVFAVGPLRADEHAMRPGEYEMTTQVQMEGMSREVPPSKNRHCYTADDVKDWKKMAQENQRKSNDCEFKDMKMSGNHGSWSMVCKSGAKGDAVMSFSADAYEMTVTMEMPGGPHGQMKMKMHTTAKRVGDCGK